MKDLSYLTDHYDEKIKKIKEINAPLNFVFVTDMHHRLHEYFMPEHPELPPDYFELATDSLDSIQYILDRCPEILCVVNGGDVGNDYDPNPEKIRKSHREVMESLYNLSVPIYSCIGNHDDAVGVASETGRDNTETAILPEELHDIFMRDNPTDKNYFYIDFDKQKYRFVFLNTSDKPYYINEKGQYEYTWRLEISDKQAEWFEKDALQTDNKILVFSHAPLRNRGIYGSHNVNLGVKPYDNILNAPRILYDIKQSKKVAAMICGHVHYDNVVYDDEMVTVSTLSVYSDEWSKGCPKRPLKTINETAFDVFSIKDDWIYITRFGAGVDRMVHIEVDGYENWDIKRNCL